VQSLTANKLTADVLAISSDGRAVAAGSTDGRLLFLDRSGERGARAVKAHTKGVTALAHGPGGRQLASATWNEIKVWDAATAEALFTFPISHANQHPIRRFSFSPDGRLLAAGYGEKETRPGDATSGAGVVQVWDLTTGRLVITLRGHAAVVLSVAFSPDGLRLASGSGGIEQAVKLWDLQSQQELLTLRGHTTPVTMLQFSTDGRRLCSGDGYSNAEVKVWDATP
jgi:WD40 repeat protein